MSDLPLGQYLRALCADRGWSRAEAARRAGVSEGYVAHAWRGDVPRGAPYFHLLVEGWGLDRAALPPEAE